MIVQALSRRAREQQRKDRHNARRGATDERTDATQFNRRSSLSSALAPRRSARRCARLRSTALTAA
eukprot:3616846-Pyramimonas_sp.AAC.1